MRALMPGIKDQIQDAMDEARTLVLGTQVLLGFQYQSVFEPRFAEFAFGEQLLSLFGLMLLLAAFCFLILPAAHHLIAKHGEDDEAQYALTANCVGLALAPFAAAFGIALYLAAARATGRVEAVGIGLVATGLAASLWYGLGFRHEHPVRRHKSVSEKAAMADRSNEAIEKTPVHDKIRHVLTEARVVIPGAQALLGFACITTLMDSFDRLPDAAKYLHLASLAAVALAVVLLMTPAAYHRLTGHGEESEDFFRLASNFVVAAMAPLALALAGELCVVVFKVTVSWPLAIGFGAVALLVFAAMWYGFPLLRRKA